MKVGDLVRYKSPYKRWAGAWKCVGVVTRCIAGTDKRKVVYWITEEQAGTTSNLKEINLELLQDPCDPTPMGAPVRGGDK